MKRWQIVSIILFMLLIGTNIWWAINAIDQAITEKYEDQEAYMQAVSLADFKAITPHLADGMSKEEIVALIEEVLQEEGFEKDGFTTIGSVSLEFDDEGQLERAIPAGEVYD